MSHFCLGLAEQRLSQCLQPCGHRVEEGSLQAGAAPGHAVSKWTLLEVKKAVPALWPEAGEGGRLVLQRQQIFLLGRLYAQSKGCLPTPSLNIYHMQTP